MITSPSGLQYLDTHIGEGEVAKAENEVSVHYTGWLYENEEAGATFDSSFDRHAPIEFFLGEGMFIKGLD